MSGLAFQIDVRDQLAQALALIRDEIAPARTVKPMAQGIMELVRAHFTALDSARANRLGGMRTHFYARAVRATSWQPTADGLVVSIQSQGIAQRYFGGWIKAKPGSALTIPARAEAYGRRAREFGEGQLKLVWPKGRDTGWLEQATDKLTANRRGIKSGQGARGVIMYWLKKQIHQDPDPTVLPTEPAIATAAASGLRNFLQALADRRGGVA